MGLQRSFIIAGFALFFIAVQLVTLYGCNYSFRTFRNKKIRIAALAYILFLNLSYLFLFYRYPLPAALKTTINHILIYPYFIYMLLCLVLFPWFVLNELFISIKKLWAKGAALIGYDDTKTKRTVPEGRRDFLKVATSALLLPVGGCSLYGTYIGRSRIAIEEQTLSFPALPQALDGLSIVQVSDLHAGVFMEGWELEPYIEI